MTRRRWLPAAAVVGVVLLVAAFAVFRPDKLFVDERVDERLDAGVAAALEEPPPTTAAPEGAAAPDAGTAPAAAPTTVAPPAEPVLVARGDFVAQGGHSVRGSAAVVRQPDGALTLVLPDLDSENGPDLQLYLSPSAAGDVDGGRYLEPLKGNIGTSTYDLPPDVDLAALPNVVIWCRRFSVPFGTATLA